MTDRSMFRAFACSLALFAGTTAKADVPAPEHVVPKEIGSRTVVLTFTLDAKAKPTAIEVVSSEVTGLNLWAKFMITAGHLKINSPGVVKIGEGKYRATISFPLEGDGPPLPPNITPPKARLMPAPTYPFELARADASGGALLRLTVDEKAKISKIEIVRASHKDFGNAAVAAVKKWQFAEPAKQDGTPITVTLFQLVTFQVEGKSLAKWEWQMCPEPALPVYSVTGSFIPVP